MSKGIAFVTELRHPTIISASATDIIHFQWQNSSFLQQLAELNISRADDEKCRRTGLSFGSGRSLEMVRAGDSALSLVVPRDGNVLNSLESLGGYDKPT
jgi:hypothetical protein